MEIARSSIPGGPGVAPAWFSHYAYLFETLEDKSGMHNVHFSKEMVKPVTGGGWAVQKASAWKEALDMHVLRLDQVGSTEKLG